jgi:hypothetical protein
VKGDPIRELVIQPDDVTVAEGEAIEFQVFAKRGERLQPLQTIDGLQLLVANPVIANADKLDLRVTGLKKGKTQVAAKFGSRRALAQLTVSPPVKPPPPPAAPVGLRFIPDLFRLEIGTPGDSIRVVQVNSDGTQEDVDHLVQLEPREPKDVIEIESSASGPVVRPRRIGQTQIDATLGTLKTDKPLLIDVAEAFPDQAQLRVLPPGLQLEVGQTGRFARVEVMPPNGRSPVRVPFKVTATPNQNFEVLPDGSIRALLPGQAVCNLTADDPSGKFEGLTTSATVEVTDPNATPPGNRGGGGLSQTDRRRRLVVSGPSETTVGAEVALRVESIIGSNSQDVTSQAQLALVAGGEELAEAQPGGVIVAKGPGRLSVRARLNDLTSTPHEIVIRPVDKNFERLELEVARGRMAVGESRSYRLWGHPLNGGARQDLTNSVTEETTEVERPQMRLTMLLPSPGTQVVAHQPGVLAGRQPGQFSLQATLGDRLSTDPITLEVTGPIEAPERLKVEPEQLQMLAGETTPPLKVLVSSSGDRSFRELDPSQAEIVLSDPEVLEARVPGQFVALKPGVATIRVSFQGLTQNIPVTVKFNPFASISLDKNPTLADNALTVSLSVAANTTDASLEYRCLLPGGADTNAAESHWVPAQREGGKLVANLKSPGIPTQRGVDHFSLVIEAKNLKTGQIDRYPYAFKLFTGQTEPSPAK